MSMPSAKRSTPKTVEAIFDIPKSELIPIVENAVEDGPITLLGMEIAHETEHKGAQSVTIIPTFYYQTARGKYGKIPIFVKRQLNATHREADNYFAFEEVGIPTPKCYGHLVGANGAEILFLEFLPEIGLDVQDEFEVREWLGLLAQISATPLPFAHFKINSEILEAEAERDKRWQQDWESSLKRMWEKGTEGELGAKIKALCGDYPSGVAILKDYQSHVDKQTTRISKDALAQGDACDHNLGWRITDQGKEIVVFDLGFKIGHRFADISYVIDGQLQSCPLSPKEIASCFLNQYNDLSGESVTLEEFLYEAAWFADADKLYSLPWLLDIALSGELTAETSSPNEIEKNRTMIQDCWLYDNLTKLLESASSCRPANRLAIGLLA